MVNEKAKKLGEALVAAKVLTPSQLDSALAAASKKNSPSLIIGLLESDLLSFRIFEKFVSGSMNIKATIIGNKEIHPEVLKTIPTEMISGRFAFPIAIKEKNAKRYLILGMVDPLDTDLLDEIKGRSGLSVVPALISLPDFKQACKRMLAARLIPAAQRFDPLASKKDPFVIRAETQGAEIQIEGYQNTQSSSSKYAPGDSIELDDRKQEDRIVLIRQGGYEEEIGFHTQHFDPAKENERRGANRPQDIDLESPGKSQRRTEQKEVSTFLGPQGSKFREELLAKLELSGSDAKLFNKDTYSREVLYKILPEVSIKRLEAIYEKLSPDLKIEALANILIQKGILTRREIINSGAISYLFGDIDL